MLQTRPQTGMCKPTYLWIHYAFSMVGGYMENLEKPQNCQNWGMGACKGMGTFSEQYGIIKNRIIDSPVNNPIYFTR